MPILILIFAVFIGIALLELSLFSLVGQEVGIMGAVGLTILTAVVGISVVRQQGLKVARDTQLIMQKGGAIGEPLIHGFFLVLSGIMLLVPGFFTDTIGAIFLIPPARVMLGRLIIHQIAKKGGGIKGVRYPGASEDEIVDCEYHEETKEVFVAPLHHKGDEKKDN